jgi:preprotein translocase subunit SecF
VSESSKDRRFFELISPDINIDFVGRQRLWVRIALAMVVASILMPIVNVLLPSRGAPLNFGVDFRGGSEVTVALSRPIDPGQLRTALEEGGYGEVEVVSVGSTVGDTGNSYQLRFRGLSPVSRKQAEAFEAAVKAGAGSGYRRVEWAEGGDKVTLHSEAQLETATIEGYFRTAGIDPGDIVASPPKPGSREWNYEVTLATLGKDIREKLEAKLGAGVVKDIPSVASVGPKAGAQLRDDAVKALLGAVFLIMIYIMFRFDVRYAPATVLGLLHDSVIMVGVLAFFYKEVTLTSVAALLTIVGFSMNDKIVVFDRVRELSTKASGADFRRLVNQALNQTLSRTVITNSTVFLVTLAMNVFAVGVIREFAFAMNIGVVVSTFSSIFIATPAVIWLNDKLFKTSKGTPRQGRVPAGREPRQPRRKSPES